MLDARCAKRGAAHQHAPVKRPVLVPHRPRDSPRGLARRRAAVRTPFGPGWWLRRLRPAGEDGDDSDHDHAEHDRGDEECGGGRGPTQERAVRSLPLLGWGVGEIEGIVADRVDPDGVLTDRCAPAGSWLSHRSLLSIHYPQGAT